MKITVNLNKLTLGEMAEAEKLGADFEKPNSLMTIMPLIYIVRKREDPDVKFEDIQALTMDDIEFESTQLDPKATPTSDKE